MTDQSTKGPSEGFLHYRWQVMRDSGPIDLDEICCRDHAVSLLKSMLHIGVTAKSEPTKHPCSRCGLETVTDAKGSKDA